MKLRIKGNSLRIRLTRSEVEKLADTGYIEEQTLFAGSKLLYALLTVDSGNGLSATLEANKITMFVPHELIKDWPQNNVVGFNSKMPVSPNNILELLLEKDFVCIDETKEDQSDHYRNPSKTC